MQTLSYTYQKPETGDKGSVWFPAMENNIQKLNDHNHDGSNSALLPAANITRPTSSIVAANWVSDGGGNYHYQVTVPVAISGAATYNDVFYYNLQCRISTVGSTYGDIVYPSIERDSATTFTVYVNDNTLDLNISYS